MRCSRDAAEMRPRCSRDAVEIRPRCSRDAAEMQPRCSRDPRSRRSTRCAGLSSRASMSAADPMERMDRLAPMVARCRGVQSSSRITRSRCAAPSRRLISATSLGDFSRRLLSATSLGYVSRRLLSATYLGCTSRRDLDVISAGRRARFRVPRVPQRGHRGRRRCR